MKAAFYVGNTTMSTGPQAGIEPAAGQVQIKVGYCGICGTDLHIFHGPNGPSGSPAADHGA